MEIPTNSSFLSFSLFLQPCDESLPKSPPASILSRKPPCSPPRANKLTQEAGPAYPSPSKRRITPSADKENQSPSNSDFSEIKLFKSSSPSLTCNRSSSSSNAKIVNNSVKPAENKRRNHLNTGKNMNLSFNHYSPQVIKPGNCKNLNSSYVSPGKSQGARADMWKTRVFTPVLEEKKRKIEKLQEFCKKISLFDQSLNKNLISADTCSTFKDCSTRNEESIIGEITPIKQEDLNDFTFNSPEVTLKYSSPPDETFLTPDSNTKTNEIRKENFTGLLAPKKQCADLLTPESNVFVLSSSSELVSEVSLSEEVSEFMERSRVDKEMQTEANLTRVLELLDNDDIIDGLKMIGKFKEIFRLINSQ